MFWKAITLTLVGLFMTSAAEGQNPDRDRIREQLEFGPEVGENFEINGRQFNLNRVGRGKLGTRVMAGDNADNDLVVISQSEDGDLHGSVLMDGKSYRVMPNGELRRAGRIKKNDVIIRETFPDDRPVAFDGADNGIVDRWHSAGWQNMLRRADGSQVGMWYTPDSDRSITYVDIFFYFDQNIGGNAKSFIDAEISHANEIFRRSGVYVRLNLVGYELVDVPVENANETIRKMDAKIGVFSNLDANRRRTNADMVHTFVTQDTRRMQCGVGYLGGYKGRWDYRDNLGVTVCHGGETFVHEIAHNFGSDHEDSNAGAGFHFWYSLGYNVRKQTGFDHISTVMSYGSAEVGVFSNPDLSCKGQPCGVAEQADNARSLNQVRKWIAKANGPSNGSSTGTYIEPDTRDSDGDGVTDYYDTCPGTPQGSQVDTFGCVDTTSTGGGSTDSGAGQCTGSSWNTCDDDDDAVADDSDNDGVLDDTDNCPNNYNPNQSDNDGDGTGNTCDSTPNGTTTPTPPGPTLSGDWDVSSHGGVCSRSRVNNSDYIVNFRGFQNNSNSGSVWAICPITRGSGSTMVAAEVTILPITSTAGNYNIRCDLVEVYEGNVEETISLSVNPGNTNTGESTHVFDPVTVSDASGSSFAIECQVPRGYAITNIRQVSGN
jgi:hypothetical protein